MMAPHDARPIPARSGTADATGPVSPTPCTQTRVVPLWQAPDLTRSPRRTAPRP